MESCRQEGKTVEEAIEKALSSLDITREEAEIEIIEEGSSGLFGMIGGSNAVVEVSKVIKPKEIGKNFIEEVLKVSNLEAEVAIDQDKTKEQQLAYNITSAEELGLIIGHRGETLDALQYLTSLAVNRETDDYYRIIIDAEGYRERREETLKRLAAKMKKRAIETGRKVMLDPMPPHERRIIHLEIKEDSRVKSYSEGEEPFRKVMIETTELQDDEAASPAESKKSTTQE